MLLLKLKLVIPRGVLHLAPVLARLRFTNYSAGVSQILSDERKPLAV